MALDVEKLTLGEVAKVEELSGQSIAEIGNDTAPKGKALAALAFVTKKREDPSYSWNDAMSLTFDQAQEILGMNDDEDEQEDPTQPEDSAPSKSGRRSKKSAAPADPQP